MKMVGFNKKTVKDINLAGKRVLLRADYNVPVHGGKVMNDYRIQESLPTIEYILKQKPAGLIIISHLGRPRGKPNADFSLLPVVKRLSQLLGTPVGFGMDCIGKQAKTTGRVTLLENLRFHEEEEKNDPGFAEAIVAATGAEVFVQDGFGVVHRAHASTDTITKLLPSVAGLLLESEVTSITRVMKEPKRPFVAVVGGAKISDKIEVLNEFIKVADAVAVVGALANNFLLAEGIKIGKSIYEPDVMPQTKEILQKARVEEEHRGFNFL